MPMQRAADRFEYQAVDAQGRRVRGSADAATAAALTHDLEGRGLVVVSVAAANGAATTQEAGRTSPAQDVLEATRALAALLGAGVPLSRALAIGRSVVPAGVAATLDDVRARVATGTSLAEALRRHPRTFTRPYCGVVRAGERSGDLAGAFALLARQLEADGRVRARLVAATTYPALLAVAGSITVVVLVQFVLPRFAELLESAGTRLPRSTAALLAASRWLSGAWPFVLGAVGLAGVAAAAVMRTGWGRRAFATLLVRTPLVGTPRRHLLAAQFARLLAVLLGGGAPLLTALDDTVESLADPLAREEAMRVRARVREGRSLHAALAEGTLFPPLLARLVAVGEESARLREFLEQGAAMCEARVERSLQRLVTLLEPAMIAGFGVIVALVALSLLQAIYGVDATSFR